MSFNTKCCNATVHSYIGPSSLLERPLPKPMSRQLTISSLSSAFALVTLALFARAGGPVDMHLGQGDLVVQIQDVSDLAR